jgi:hypothetical protein
LDLAGQRGVPEERRHGILELLDAIALAIRDAGSHLVGDQMQPNLVEGSLDGGELREDLPAVGVLLEHALDAAQLTLGTPETHQ